MFAILRGANGRRHEVDFDDDPVAIEVAISPAMVQVTMTAADPGDPAREAASSPLPSPVTRWPQPWAAAAARPTAHGELGLRLVGDD